jgi:exopolysaccharide biosynthesis polyprenyl glycosylphosphotransferase
MQQHPESGYRVVATYSADDTGLAALRGLLQADAVDDIFFLAPELTESRQTFLELAEEFHVAFRYVPELLNAGVGVPTLRFDIGVPVIEVLETTMQGWGRLSKRLFDIVFAVLLLVLLSPLCLLVGLAILVETGGPIIFKSTRVGRARSFTIYKFRSMQLRFCIGTKYGGEAAQTLYDTLVETSSDRSGPVPKIANDPRITRVGRLLRRFSLDELPQLVNVLRGDMSLVGPRPHFPWEVERYERHHRKVLAVKPGMTGLAQVSGRSDLDFEDEVRLDRYYIEHWNFGLDLLLMLRTIAVIFRSRRAL